MPWIGPNQQSFGAMQVSNVLRRLNFRWYREHSDVFCYTSRTCRFDFAVWRNGKVYLIEFDGEQHGYQRTRRDRMKEEFCERNNIPLLILRDTEVFGDQLEWLLSSFVGRTVHGEQAVHMTPGTWYKWRWRVAEEP